MEGEGEKAMDIGHQHGLKPKTLQNNSNYNKFKSIYRF